LSSSAGDGFLNAAERALTGALIGALAANDYDAIGYAVVDTATDCRDAAFDKKAPGTDSRVLSEGSTYKVCVRLSDTAGNPPVHGASATFVTDYTPPVAVMTGAP